MPLFGWWFRHKLVHKAVMLLDGSEEFIFDRAKDVQQIQNRILAERQKGIN